MPRSRLVDRHLLAGPSVAGVPCAALAFVAALFPSMVPRSDLIQGILAGIAVSCGYLIGAALAALARLLQIGQAGFRNDRRIRQVGVTLAAGLVAYGLWVLPDWANSARGRDADAIRGHGPPSVRGPAERQRRCHPCLAGPHLPACGLCPLGGRCGWSICNIRLTRSSFRDRQPAAPPRHHVPTAPA